MPAYIRNEEKAIYGRPLDEDELREKLINGNDGEILASLDRIKAMADFAPFLIGILKVAKSHKRQVIRSIALLVLVYKKYDKEVQFLHHDKMITVVPKELNDPFIVPGYSSIEEFSYALQSAYHDPSIANNALNIISSYLLYNYPDKLDLNAEESLVIFGYIAKKLLKINLDDLEKVCEKKGLDYSKVTKRMEEVEEDLANF